MREISIIVPVYNKINTIKNAVSSVLNQTFEDFELLLIDDGSTDGSSLICDELAAGDQRVRVIHTDNRGVSAARNTGLENAAGKYISFIDADDQIDKTFLEKLHDSMTENSADLAVCDYYEIRKGRKTVHSYGNLNTGDKVFEYIREDLLCILWNKLFVREKIKHLFDESISTCEDSIFCIRYYLDNDPKIAFVNETLYGYIVCGDGLSSTYNDGAFDGINKLLSVNGKLLGRIEDDSLKALARHHICRVYYYGTYTYVFENLSMKPFDGDVLSVIGCITRDDNYRKIIRFVLAYPFRDAKAEKNSIAESLIIIFSLLRMKRSIYLLSKIKNVWKR